ncbi:MAG: coproporphyrinogen oxidase, partial [Sphingomonas bacterium]|nr:coproporphyrinogen oxidase [Sphingomonas bacterium]
IYALPGQSEAEWDAQLARALGFGTGHLSLYQLTIEPGTRFATLAARGELTPLDPDEAATLFELTRAATEAAGIPAYEISNHARTGEQSRHNLTYWRYGDYLGVGPGAHGRRGGHATLRHKKPENWMARVAARGDGIESEEPLPGAERAQEALLMGLRLREGVDLARIAQISGLPVTALVDAGGVERLTALGLVQQTGDHLRVREAGMLLLDAILPEIVSA